MKYGKETFKTFSPIVKLGIGSEPIKNYRDSAKP
nr:hypothetical protein [Mucilaginibacter sp. SP1R1]